MTCIHLQKLYRLCQEHDIKVSSSDVVRVACKQCQQIDVCPAVLTDEYDHCIANSEVNASVSSAPELS